MTLIVWPAMVSVPKRNEVVGFGSTCQVKRLNPLPLAVSGYARCSHGTVLAAIHEQTLEAVTVMVSTEPDDGTDNWLRESLYVQGVPCCVTGTSNPATLTIPIRWPGSVFA